MKPVAFTREERLKIKELLDSGMRSTAVSLAMNRPKSTVRREIERGGGEKNYNPDAIPNRQELVPNKIRTRENGRWIIRPELKAAMMEDLANGLTIDEAAKKHDLTREEAKKVTTSAKEVMIRKKASAAISGTSGTGFATSLTTRISTVQALVSDLRERVAELEQQVRKLTNGK